METEKFKVKFSIAAVKSAIKNAGSIESATYEVPIIGVEDIRPRMKIWGVTSNPISDTAKASEPNTLRYYAVKPVEVSDFSLTAREGFCVVNGTVDIPDGVSQLKGTKGMWMETEEDARALAGLFTEVELAEAKRLEEQAHEAVVFLEKQIEENMF